MCNVHVCTSIEWCKKLQYILNKYHYTNCTYSYRLKNIHTEDWLGKFSSWYSYEQRSMNQVPSFFFNWIDTRFYFVQNNGENALHGGLKGLDKVVWNTAVSSTSIVFSYLSKDGEEGYPGGILVQVTDKWLIKYRIQVYPAQRVRL